MKDFEIVMGETSDLELYKILFHKRDSYTPEALISAEKEFRSRSFSEDRLTELKKTIENENQIRSERKKKNLQFRKSIRSSISMAIPTEKGTTEKSLLSLTIFLGISYLFFLFSDLQTLWWVLEEMNMWSLYTLLPFILFPIGIYGLWKVKTYGWYIITGLLTHNAVLAFSQFYLEYRYFGIFERGAFLGDLEGFFPRTPVGFIMLNLLILSGIIYYLNKKKITEYFSINRWNGIAYIFSLAVLSIFFSVYV